jgi:hypothetical protein
MLTLDRPGANMAEVTYYVALPFIANDDGVVAGGMLQSQRRGDAR